jgi:hypothetical protein
MKIPTHIPHLEEHSRSVENYRFASFFFCCFLSPRKTVGGKIIWRKLVPIELIADQIDRQ